MHVTSSFAVCHAFDYLSVIAVLTKHRRHVFSAVAVVMTRDKQLSHHSLLFAIPLSVSVQLLPNDDEGHMLKSSKHTYQIINRC